MASPRPTSCAPRSQAMSPCRGSDPDSRGSWPRTVCPRQQRPQPQQPDVADHQSLIGWRGRQPVDRGLGFLHVVVGPTIEQCLHQNARRWKPHARAVPRRNRWSTAARISGMAPSRSPRRPSHAPSRRRRPVNRPGRTPVQEHVADLGQQLLSAVTLCVSSGGAPARRPASIRARASARSSLDRSAIRRASSISRIAESSASSTPLPIPWQ